MTAASELQLRRRGGVDWRARLARIWRHGGPLLLFGCLGFGCAAPVTHGAGAREPRPPAASADQPSVDEAPDYRGLDAQGAWEGDALLERLGRRRVVCLGERHPVAADHLVQADVIRRLAEASRQRGETFAVGFEMFQLPAQPVLERYGQGLASESELLSQSEYEQRWGFDFDLYRPVLEAARAADAALLALNAPREWTRSVARQGLKRIDPAVRRQFPELNLSDSQHQQFFQRAMAHHPHGSHGNPSSSMVDANFYAAQVLWDETMAERAAQWLADADKSARLVIVAGAGHCHRSAIPRRLERRLREPVLGVRILNAGALRQHTAPADTEFDLLLVTADVEGQNANER